MWKQLMSYEGPCMRCSYFKKKKQHSYSFNIKNRKNILWTLRVSRVIN